MRSVTLTAVALVLACVVFYFSASGDSHVQVSNARAVPIHADPGRYLISVTFQNSGRADALIAARSPNAGSVTLAPPGGPLLIPGQRSSQLASDGAHLRLANLGDGIGQGSVIPLTLVFRDAGEVTTRVTIGGPGEMDHSMMRGGVRSADKEPDLHFSAPVIEDNQATVQVTLSDFVFRQVDNGAAHVDGEGHAHVYLNGLKLGRLYASEIFTGELPPGTHILTVSLNAHTHQPYLDAAGQPISSSMEIEIQP